MQIKSSKKIPLIELLQELYPESSKNTLRCWLERGRVTVEGRVVKKANHDVEDGQVVAVGTKSKFLDRGLKIVYEDDDLVVIDKPANLLSVATDVEMEVSAHALLKRRYNTRRVFPIHRLDKDTSGLLVFAYTQKAREHLKEQLASRTMHREYRTLVHGHPGKGTWRGFLKEDTLMRVHVCTEAEGREAVTHFETLEKRGPCSYLKIKLETGRKHQIRVQASNAGFPIVGDSRYGLEEDQKSFQLRAVGLSFVHPTTGLKCTFFEETAGRTGSKGARRPKQGRPSPQRRGRRG